MDSHFSSVISLIAFPSSKMLFSFRMAPACTRKCAPVDVISHDLQLTVVNAGKKPGVVQAFPSRKAPRLPISLSSKARYARCGFSFKVLTTRSTVPAVRSLPERSRNASSGTSEASISRRSSAPSSSRRASRRSRYRSFVHCSSDLARMDVPSAPKLMSSKNASRRFSHLATAAASASQPSLPQRVLEKRSDSTLVIFSTSLARWMPP
mmetsp:Transcript_10021/g.37965  ORF Transcript_10021/g.37965 Transcript_10021/m.37965 type:complete len:208 (-) Transcript_10021:575-1198(-)